MDKFDEVLMKSFANGVGIGVGAITTIVTIPFIAVDALIKMTIEKTKDFIMPEDLEEKKVSWLKAD